MLNKILKKENILALSLLDSLGLTIYIVLIAILMNDAEKVFGKMDNYLGPVAFLLLFVISAIITGTLFLGLPVLFYLDNKKSEAIKLFFYTLIWLVVLMIIVFALQAII